MASRKRRKPGIGPRGIFGLLTVTVAVFLAGNAVWPNLSHSAKEVIRGTALVVFCIFLCINLIVFFNIWRRG